MLPEARVPRPAWGAGLVLAAALGITACFREGAVDGGTETETSVAGRITDSLGRPSARAQVVLLPEDYNPVAKDVSLPERTTDDDGRYALADIRAGTYNIQASEPGGTEAALIRGIRVMPPPTDHDSTLAVPDGVLRMPGEILIPWEALPHENGWVYLPGTTVATRITPQNGNPDGLKIAGVPAGRYAELQATSGETRGKNLLRDTLTVGSGGTAIASPYADWKYGRRLLLNTAADGVIGDVTGYPLLFRLDETNFDFSRALPGGADIRFAKADGTPLPYQIERWDAASRKAAIWILVDTVFGNRDDQQLAFHYGKEDAVSQSDGAAVFGASSGFSGVWHLGEEAPGTGAAGLYADAAGVRHGDDQISATSGEGIIGLGHAFDGIDDHIDLPASSRFLAAADQPITLSAWARPDPVDWGGSNGRDARIIDVHRSDTNGSSIALGFGRGQKAFFYTHHDPVWHLSPDTLSLFQWHHFALTFDGKAFQLYVDGMPAGPSIPGGLLAGGTFRAKIGKYGNTPIHAFPGNIDEPRIAGSWRSASWMKLDFHSQKPGSTVATLLP